MGVHHRIGLSAAGGLAMLAVLGGCATGGTASAASTQQSSTTATTSLAGQGTSATTDSGPADDSGSSGVGDTGADPWGGFAHNSLLGNEMHQAYTAFHRLPAKQQLSLCTAAENGGTAASEAWLSAHHVNRQGMSRADWNLFLGKQCIPYLGSIFDQ